MSAPIKHISDIDTSTIHGKMLVAAVTLLSSESLVPKSYDEVISECADLAAHMYGEVIPTPQPSY